MKKGILLGSMTLMVFGMVEAASATLVNFDLAGGAGGSSVTVTDSARWGNLTGALAPDLDSQIFSLNDGETKAVDFFTLKASGLALGSNYTVRATLAFDSPNPMDPAVGDGGGKFSTMLGLLSGGTLSWPNQPTDFVQANGNKISVNFENGCTIGLGNTAMVHAYITNQGGGIAPTNAPVPEPATMFLFGTGLMSFAGLSLRKKK